MRKSITKSAQSLMRLRWGVLLLVLIFAAFLAVLIPKSQPAEAATGVNASFNYQGRLLTTAGATVPDGDYNMEFTIVQDGDGCNPTSGTYPCSGSVEWTETWDGSNKVRVANGYFSVYLGSITAFGSNVDWNQNTLWLGVNIGGTGAPSYDGVMKPMKRLGASPYALNSQYLGGLSSANFVQLAQGVQADTTTLSSIFLNKTGASGNILQFQKNGTDVMILDNSGNFGVGGTTTLNVSNSRALFVGPNAISNPAFQVDTSAASSATGVIVSSKAATNGVNLAAISSGTNEDFSIDAKGSGALNLGNLSTGNVLLAGGSSGTGCTVTNSTGAFACTAGLSGTTGGFSSTISASNFSGSSSGTNTGDQTSVTGNAGTATALQTARNINGVSFNGTADITVTAAAGTLTGATLASGVTASSLTSLGTLGGLTVVGTADINATGSAVTTIGALTSTDLVLRDANWNITGAGAATFASVSSATGTFSGAIAANGGITFNNSTDTLGAHTWAGTVNANNNILTNIGNSGTDFVASTGALTLAGVLTANGGVTVAAGQNVTMSSGAGVFTQTFTGTTTIASAITANSLISGKGLSIASSSTALTTGSLLDVALSGAATTASGYVANISNTSATSTAGGLFISNNGTGNSFRVDDATSDTTPFLIDSAGKIGIGTTTPTTNLQLIGQAVIGADRPFLEDVVAGLSQLSINRENDNAVQAFRVASATANHSGAFFAARSRGTLATPTASDIGDYLFQIGASGYTTTDMSSVCGCGATGKAPANIFGGSPAIIFIQDGASTTNAAPAAITFTSSAGVERMRITSSGNVGIGTPTPSNLVSVSPTQYSAGTASQSGTTVTGSGTTWTSSMVGSQFTFANGVSAGTITGFTSTTSLTVTASQTVTSQAYLISYTGFQVDTLGHVGIGIAPSSTRMLEVAGNSSITSGYIAKIEDINAGNGDTVLLVVGGENTFTGTSTLVAFRRPDGTNIGSITQNASLTVAYNTSSDARLKENISDSATGLDTLLKIKVRDYSYISDGNHEIMQGMLAQELNEVYGQAVTVGGDDVNESPWAIDYGKLTPLLIKGLQDLNAKHETLQDDFDTQVAGLSDTIVATDLSDNTNVAELTTDLAALGDRVTTLENQVSQLGAGFANGGIVTGDAEFRANVLFAANVTFEDDVAFNGTVALSDKTRGVDLPVTTSDTTKVITFAQAQVDAKYAVQCTPGWNSNCYVTNKTKDGFTLNFTTPSVDSTLDWMLVR